MEPSLQLRSKVVVDLAGPSQPLNLLNLNLQSTDSDCNPSLNNNWLIAQLLMETKVIILK